MGLIDATALGSDISMFVVEELVTVGMGLDVRYRAHTTGDLVHSASISHHQAVVGIPFTVTAVSPPDLPWFATGSLVVRPNPVAYGEGDRKGTLTPGKLADMILVSENPYTVDPSELLKIETLATWKEDRLVYGEAGGQKVTPAAP